MNTRIVVAYVPVLHEGYLEFFQKHTGSQLWLIGPDLYGEPFHRLNRDVRALSPATLLSLISALTIFSEVRYATEELLRTLSSQVTVIVPNEDISRYVVETYMPKGVSTELETHLPYRRWDMSATKKMYPILADEEVTEDEFFRELMEEAYRVALQSPDWWRQVGGLLIQNRKVLIASYNTHAPSKHKLYADGDPRINFDAGEFVELTAAQHMERRIVATAARLGIKTSGCKLITTTFTCAPCAYDVGEAGISELYYCEGFSNLDAVEALRGFGVKIFRVLRN